ncbi:putative lipoprotein [Hyphomonas neptunium ATCC 15444]|uniref:Putative lipoprotein n=2 Tax=Hyphomonas TaxID=85 RepID=Q0C5C2_HYPNA|nr:MULTISPECIES: hypothetical protein [Hyphomonas]ABI76394.1 putative lipoprotein [Hyphomonas neptunium ATCC 15444]KCZ95504.1 putative lipoprotein [Hyphomonas hirschiana VP5]
MSLRFVAAGAFALLASACAGWPGASPDAAVTACGGVMAQSAAYASSHAAAREEKLMVIRFASPEAMAAYNAKTRAYEAEAAGLVTARDALAADYGLAEDTQAYTFDHTTDEEADARISAAKACAAPLTE